MNLTRATTARSSSGAARGSLIYSRAVQGDRRLAAPSLRLDSYTVVCSREARRASGWRTSRSRSVGTAAGESGAISPSGEWIAAAGDDGTARVWAAYGCRAGRDRADDAPMHGLTRVALDEEKGRILTTFDPSGIVRVWAPDGQPVATIPDRSRRRRSAVHGLSRGRRRLDDALARHGKKERPQSLHSAAVRCVAISDGNSDGSGRRRTGGVWNSGRRATPSRARRRAVRFRSAVVRRPAVRNVHRSRASGPRTAGSEPRAARGARGTARCSPPEFQRGAVPSSTPTPSEVCRRDGDASHRGDGGTCGALLAVGAQSVVTVGDPVRVMNRGSRRQTDSGSSPRLPSGAQTRTIPEIDVVRIGPSPRPGDRVNPASARRPRRSRPARSRRGPDARVPSSPARPIHSPTARSPPRFTRRGGPTSGIDWSSIRARRAVAASRRPCRNQTERRRPRAPARPDRARKNQLPCGSRA